MNEKMRESIINQSKQRYEGKDEAWLNEQIEQVEDGILGNTLKLKVLELEVKELRMGATIVKEGFWSFENTKEYQALLREAVLFNKDKELTSVKENVEGLIVMKEQAEYYRDNDSEVENEEEESESEEGE